MLTVLHAACKALFEVRRRVNFRPVSLSEAVGMWSGSCSDGTGFELLIRVGSHFQLTRKAEDGASQETTGKTGDGEAELNVLSTVFSGTFEIGAEETESVVFSIKTMEPQPQWAARVAELKFEARCKIKSDWDAKVWKMLMIWPRIDMPEGMGAALPDVWPRAGSVDASWRCVELKKTRQREKSLACC